MRQLFDGVATLAHFFYFNSITFTIHNHERMKSSGEGKIRRNDSNILMLSWDVKRDMKRNAVWMYG